MVKIASLAMLLLTFFRTVRTHEECESNYWSESECKAAYSEDGLPCHWNKPKQECHTIICADYSSSYQCDVWNKKYGCQWFTLQQSSYGDIDLCHSECLKYVDILFTIDISSSVMEQSSNSADTQDYIITVMTLWWSIQETIISKYFALYDHIDIASKTAEYTRFGLTYFAAETEVYLNLEYGLTLDDYIDKVDSLFSGNYFEYLPFSKDDTNIVGAIHEAYTVFHNGESYYFNKHGLTTKRLSILVTDGEPTIPEFAASPCASDYDFDELFHYGISGESIEFYVALIGSETDENVFECFEKYGGTIEPILGYYDLKNAIPGMKTATNVCPSPTYAPSEIPTNDPTDLPTCSPTDKPSDEPTPKPTHTPTDKPSEKPTHRPSHRPTHWPTNKPSDKPTDSPTAYYAPPTHRPTEKPVPNVYIQPSNPTKTPSTKNTKWWANGWDKNVPKPTPKPTDAPKPTPAHWWVTNSNSRTKSGKMYRNSGGRRVRI